MACAVLLVSLMATRNLRNSLSFLAVTALLGTMMGIGCSSAPPGESLGSSSADALPGNAKIAFDYLTSPSLPYSKPLTAAQAAGVIGNLMQEDSTLDPTEVQQWPQPACTGCTLAGGCPNRGDCPGTGIAQWSRSINGQPGGRWDTDANDNVLWYAREHGNESPTALTTQLGFLWYELNFIRGDGLNDLRTKTTPADAALSFQNNFEGCSVCDPTTREQYANDVYDAYKGSTPAPIPQPATCGGGSQAITRATEWVTAKVPYCEAANHRPDGDPSCSAICTRPDNAAWDAYRSDCSGLVSWAWGLSAPGVTTRELAPFQEGVSKSIPAEALQPGDAVNNWDHVLLFAGWVNGSHTQARFIQEPGCAVPGEPPHAINTVLDVTKVSGISLTIPGATSGSGDVYTAIHYTGGGCAGTSTPVTPPPARSCYSETLARTVADNTCVQSRYDGCNLSEINSTCNWYECNSGSWVLRYTDTTACSATYPIGYTGTGSSGGTGCHSDTLRREVSDNACVQSDMNGAWYQCANGNWVDRWTDPTACNGAYPLHSSSTNQGSGCHSSTLGRTVADNACVESSNDDWYQCDNGNWTDRWTDPAACNGTYPLTVQSKPPEPKVPVATVPVSGSVGERIAAIALNNVGKMACSTNTAGEDTYAIPSDTGYNSCHGDGGSPEYWCADFAGWVWGQAGQSTTNLSAAAASFLFDYGEAIQSTPHVGDAVVFANCAWDPPNGSCQGWDPIEHVAIVTQVNSDGTIESVSGDWNGDGNGEVAFASSSRVVHNVPAYPGRIGAYSSTMNFWIAGFVAPR